MDYYTQQQQTPQSSHSTSAAAVDNNNCISSSSSHPNANAITPSTADAATFAIAKDMLQLHHGPPLNNSIQGGNVNSNGNAVGDILAAAAAAASPAPSSHAISPPVVVSQQQQQQQHPHQHNNNDSSNNSALQPPPDTALGFLKYEQEFLYISESCTIIGRNSSTSHVHFHVAENNLVSRKHFQVLFDADTRDFYVQCLSKNGIFVDDFLQRRNADPLKLPQSCYFRFPSTEIRIQFESFIHGRSGVCGVGIDSPINATGGVSGLSRNSIHSPHSSGTLAQGNSHVIVSPAPPEDQYQHLQQQQQQQHQPHQQHHTQQPQHLPSSSTSSASHLLDSSNIIYSPLKISIPKKEQKSPYLSPTGTISAANSCPASPRQGFHQSQANYNNYSNNNLQNQELFQTPSTASYNHNEKPPYSYAQLIVQAISAAPDKQLTLSGIYSFIVKHYPYYRKETNKGWQNSIRHNLSLNRYFIKVARSQDEPGKGSFWRIDPESGAKLIDHSYKKRRQRSSQGFRPSYGMPRSAPVSPSHMEYFADNSRESSPLQDIVLQSAPGSPGMSGMSLENRAAEGEMMYNSQNVHQGSSNNSHSQYYNSPYYVSNHNATLVQHQPQQPENQNSGGISVNNTGNTVGALIALKRNHAMVQHSSSSSSSNVGGSHAAQEQQSLHPDIIYEEMPTDYSGNLESGDECGVGNSSEAPKRPKYISEVL